MSLRAERFPPITPANISTLSIREQILLPLLCTSLSANVRIPATLETLSLEIHDLSSPVANLDLTPQPQISPCFKHPFAISHPISHQPLRPLGCPNTPTCHLPNPTNPALPIMPLLGQPSPLMITRERGGPLQRPPP